MKINGLQGLSDEQIRDDLERGAKFVIYNYAFSLVIVSFKRSSNIFFVRPGRSRLVPGLPYSLIAFLFGWWGIPHGIIFTISSLWTNFNGGKDVTNEVLSSLSQGA